MGVQEVIKFLESNRNTVSQKQVCIGIDGFVDKIVRPVKSTDADNNLTFFSTIDEFGNYLASKAGMSCGVRICEKFTKFGGNAPIMANALATAGVKVDCVGTLGSPRIDDIFENSVGKVCNLYSVCAPGYTTAVEFEDGKIMLGEYDALQQVDFQTFVDIIGLDKLKEFFDKSVLVGLVNFAAITKFNSIMRGIIENILSKSPIDKSKYIFFDTADVLKRSKADILELVSIMKEINKYRKVIVGLNASEAILFYKTIFDTEEVPDTKPLGDKLYKALECDLLVVHTLMDALAWEGDNFANAPSLYVRKPKLSTGGGDNFNAGLCLGFLMGMDLEGALYTANATSGSYVRNAQSPTYDILIDTLKNWDKLIEKPAE